MATNEYVADENLDKLKANMSRVEELTQRLVKVMSSPQSVNPALNSPSPDVFSKAAGAYWQAMLQDPGKMMEQQAEYWGKALQNFIEAQSAFAGAAETDLAEEKDPRFSNPMWQTNPYFKLIKQQYKLNAEALTKAVSEIEVADHTERRRIEHFSRQIVDMMAPTNFFGTNPDALQKAMETEGQSLVDGLENLVNDLEANRGTLVVKLSDDSAFKLGENIATTPGQVVFRNRMLELIQYSPTTEQVYETPIIVFPPWINKFYILDLKAQNSFIKWVTEQGYTIFVVSWINPDETYADVGMEDYIAEGYLTAIDVVKEITQQDQINAIGYCIAGTTLSLTLSLLKQRGDNSVKSATFFTALTDFSDQGEFTPFLQNDFIDGIEAQIDATGILQSFIMARTFSYLRANDLIYRPAIKSYMMGETPPAFDLLYWNGDGSGLPGKMAMQYLRGLCQRNEFARGGFDLLGTTLKLSEVDIPLMSIACETDHIAAWKDCYRGVQQMGSKDKTFVVSESGHIAGIVNPPSKKKYGHYLNADLGLTPDDWFDSAQFNEGSWWPYWEQWLRPRSGKKIKARQEGSKKHPPIMPAPGSYVTYKAK